MYFFFTLILQLLSYSFSPFHTCINSESLKLFFWSPSFLKSNSIMSQKMSRDLFYLEKSLNTFHKFVGGCPYKTPQLITLGPHFPSGCTMSLWSRPHHFQRPFSQLPSELSLKLKHLFPFPESHDLRIIN